MLKYNCRQEMNSQIFRYDSDYDYDNSSTNFDSKQIIMRWIIETGIHIQDEEEEEDNTSYENQEENESVDENISIINEDKSDDEDDEEDDDN